MKEIYFCVDNVSYNSLYDYCDTIVLGYEDTEKAISNGESCIATMSLAHLSFNFLGNYDIYLCKGDNKVKIEAGMQVTHNGAEGILRIYNDLLVCFKAGWFDELLNSKE